MRKLKITELDRLTPEEYVHSAKMPLVVVLDDVRSMHNVGSVFRTADAFRVEQIMLCGITACPPRAEIHKTALGAEDSVCWTYHANAKEAVDALHELGYVVLAVEQVEQSISLEEISEKLPSALTRTARGYVIVMGNEVRGVAQEVVNACDGAIEIPQFGTKHSLNVSVSAGMVIWEFAKLYMKDISSDVDSRKVNT